MKKTLSSTVHLAKLNRSDAFESKKLMRSLDIEMLL